MIHSSKIGGMIASVSRILAMAMIVVTDRSAYFVVIDEGPLVLLQEKAYIVL